nr:hypothetical protein [Pleurocapsa sp. MO_226.B13]
QLFVPFGLELPALDKQTLSDLSLSEDDLILLSQALNGYSPWLERTVPPLHLLRASGVLKRPVSEIVERLQLFVPFGLELPELNWQELFELRATADDFLMLSKHLNGDTPLLQGDVSPLHIARAADLRNEPVSATFERLKQFAPILKLNLPEENPESWDLDSLVAESWV